MQVHYERFRFDKLREMMYPGGPRDYRVSTNIVWSPVNRNMVFNA